MKGIHAEVTKDVILRAEHSVRERLRHQRRNKNSKEQMLEKVEGQEARALMGELIPLWEKEDKGRLNFSVSVVESEESRVSADFSPV